MVDLMAALDESTMLTDSPEVQAMKDSSEETAKGPPV